MHTAFLWTIRYRLNDDLIPAEGFPTEGASYEFVDTGLRNRKTYYYILEDIDLGDKGSDLHY
jgi:hypothetical protein